MRDAAVYVSVPGGDLRKGGVVVRGVFLQEGVPFCKQHLFFYVHKATIKNVCLQYFSFKFYVEIWATKKYTFWRGNILMNIDREKLVKQLARGWGAVQSWLQEWMSEKEAHAYSEGIDIGIEKTISALYEANVDDDMIISLLNKHWGICWDEAERRLQCEKRNAPSRIIRQYLQREGLSDQEVQHFFDSNRILIKLRENPELRKLRNNPAALIDEIKKL